MNKIMEIRIPDQRGFTLTETMIAVIMSGTIVAAGLGALTVTQKTSRITGQVVNTQTTARNALDMITADLKLAGFGLAGLVGGGVGNCAVNGTPSALVPADNNALGADTGPDSISMVVPMTNSVAAAGALWQVNVPGAPGTIGGPNNPIAQIPLPTNATTAMGNAVPGGFAALPGMSVTIAGVAGSRIAAGGALPAALNLNPAIPAPATFGAGTQVYLLQCITYQVIPPPDALNLCQGNAPCLVRGVAPVGAGGPPNCNNPGNACVPIMDGVEDLQLAYACDGCNININSGVPDGAIDDMNGSNSFDQGDFLTDINWFLPPSSAMTPSKIRMVQVNIVARQTRNDQGVGEANQIMVNSTVIPTVSDHNHANGVFVLGDNATPAQQQSYLQFRRRILTRTVELRNQRA
jgi:type IV pilus assembly protein PilW